MLVGVTPGKDTVTLVFLAEMVARPLRENVAGPWTSSAEPLPSLRARTPGPVPELWPSTPGFEPTLAPLTPGPGALAESEDAWTGAVAVALHGGAAAGAAAIDGRLRVARVRQFAADGVARPRSVVRPQNAGTRAVTLALDPRSGALGESVHGGLAVLRVGDGAEHADAGARAVVGAENADVSAVTADARCCTAPPGRRRWDPPAWPTPWHRRRTPPNGRRAGGSAEAPRRMSIDRAPARLSIPDRPVSSTPRALRPEAAGASGPADASAEAVFAPPSVGAGLTASSRFVISDPLVAVAAPRPAHEPGPAVAISDHSPPGTRDRYRL